jgi:hypothetical protein
MFKNEFINTKMIELLPLNGFKEKYNALKELI